MLPSGFHWRDWLDGWALTVGGANVATISREEAAFRVCLNSNNGRAMRYEFFGAEETARRYVEAWARKWEATIRSNV